MGFGLGFSLGARSLTLSSTALSALICASFASIAFDASARFLSFVSSIFSVRSLICSGDCLGTARHLPLRQKTYSCVVLSIGGSTSYGSMSGSSRAVIGTSFMRVLEERGWDTGDAAGSALGVSFSFARRAMRSV